MALIFPSGLFIVKPIINWALPNSPNSLNAYDRHSDWHKLEVYATKMSTPFFSNPVRLVGDNPFDLCVRSTNNNTAIRWMNSKRVSPTL